MNSHLLKKNDKRFKELNITKWQEKGITGKGIKVGIIGYSEGSHHNGAWLIQQVVPDSEIIEYNIMDKNSISWEVAFNKIIDDDIDVICSSLRKETWNKELEKLSKKMHDKGMILIDSSDNEGKLIDAYPAKSVHWIAIGAYNERFESRAEYSSYGDKLFGLGYTDYACMNYRGDYIPISHTSGTTQVIAGIAAMLKQTNNVNTKEFKRIMIENIIKLSDEVFNIEVGYGLLRLPNEVPEKSTEEDDNHMDFKDVKKDSWYYKAVEWAVETGLLKGHMENGKKLFKPNEPLTRAEYAQAEYNKSKK